MPLGKRESGVPAEGDELVSPDLVSAEAADAAVAEAEARAEAARARANELRRRLETSRQEAQSPTEDAPEDAAETTDVPAAEAQSADEFTPPKRRRLRAPRPKTVAAAAAVLLIAGLSGTTGYLVWEHSKAEAQRQRTAEYAAAARQGVVNLMSMDYTKAKESVQRIVDDSTGKFKTNMEDNTDELVRALQDSKMTTKVTVNDAAVDSMDAQSAVVLVAATSHREGPNAPKEDQQPRVWRVVVTVERDGGQIKVSDVEFA
ncbi:hypothetical protein BayCH28_09120 [Mycolicibacterium sp. CH28]|uniref:hypothetical protein n=1 Tax=Mycolicibacterium sp. CH28 TaxID=2512237 RepID=UPI001080EEF6|nr:hypothetical protein [Mycolicibacterium sp. CH28]TGD87958.1 hypothetical protein BayCH28_09120 [Mycolicibacterium sp. CH28]